MRRRVLRAVQTSGAGTPLSITGSAVRAQAVQIQLRRPCGSMLRAQVKAARSAEAGRPQPEQQVVGVMSMTVVRQDDALHRFASGVEQTGADRTRPLVRSAHAGPRLGGPARHHHPTPPGGPDVLTLADAPSTRARPRRPARARPGGRRQLHRHLPPQRAVPGGAAVRARPGGCGPGRGAWVPMRSASRPATWSPGRDVPGSYAELARVPGGSRRPVPDGVGAEQAAAVLLQGMTAHFLDATTPTRCAAGTGALCTRPRAASACCSSRWRRTLGGGVRDGGLAGEGGAGAGRRGRPRRARTASRTSARRSRPIAGPAAARRSAYRRAWAGPPSPAVSTCCACCGTMVTFGQRLGRRRPRRAADPDGEGLAGPDPADAARLRRHDRRAAGPRGRRPEPGRGRRAGGAGRRAAAAGAGAAGARAAGGPGHDGQVLPAPLSRRQPVRPRARPPGPSCRMITIEGTRVGAWADDQRMTTAERTTPAAGVLYVALGAGRRCTAAMRSSAGGGPADTGGCRRRVRTRRSSSCAVMVMLLARRARTALAGRRRRSDRWTGGDRRAGRT